MNMNNQKILAIIPARGKSKVIPRKNIRLLAGKPLIAYSIETALKSKYIDRVVVSTEDDEIADVAKIYGAKVIKRPEELARDDSPTIDVVFHALDVLKLEDYNPDILVLLQPTSPLRTREDIDNAIKLFLEKDCESVVSVCESIHLYWSFKIEERYLKPVFDKKYLKMRRQDLPKLYLPNGAIFVTTPVILRMYNSFYCNKTLPYIMPTERSIDIDNEKDFILAEILMKKFKMEP